MTFVKETHINLVQFSIWIVMKLFDLICLSTPCNLIDLLVFKSQKASKVLFTNKTKSLFMMTVLMSYKDNDFRRTWS